LTRRKVRLRHGRLHEISLLYVVNARAGTLRTHNGALQLTLSGVDPHAVWFSDAVARESLLTAGRRMGWRGSGFH
jgi:hypothetical protein